MSSQTVNQSAPLNTMVRFVLALISAFIVVIALFVFMQWIISSSDRLDTNQTARKIIDFVQVKSSAELIVDRAVKPKKPEMQTNNVVQPSFDTNMDFDTSIDNGLNLGQVDMATDMSIDGGIALGPMEKDAEYLPIVKVQPSYPVAAAKRGIEGFVIVEYTVTKKGSTSDLKILEANPANVFERAALAAASRFKYKPKLVDGVAVEVKGVSNRFNFKLER